MLQGSQYDDGLLLRLALARRVTKSPLTGGWLDTVAGRFEANRRRGDTVHQREEARFLLALGNDPARALALATANWGVQHEPWDARLLLEAARAAGDPQAAAPVLAWLKQAPGAAAMLGR